MAETLQLAPITRRIPADRQGAKRHYGVHPYFTRRPANVVREYIQHFTRAGESVLDPFGGSGVSAIEAMLLNRRGIHNDINPLANFIAAEIADTSLDDTRCLRQAFLEVEANVKAEVEQVASLPEQEVERRLHSLRLPENIRLPKTSDAEMYYELFSARQLLALGLLKQAIDRLDDESVRGSLLLAWSSTLGKLNRTFLSARGRMESRGGSSIFSIFRYKVANHPIELPAWNIFRERFMNVLKGKDEVLKQKRLWVRTEGWRGSFEAHCVDIADLPKIIGGEVDYIFTDPPYGGHIAYLDLSVLWNHWLGFKVPQATKEKELIVGGELRLSEEYYIQRLKESIHLCVDMLKKNRWMSVVFQHWNTKYFEAILEEAAQSGASLMAAVPQIGDTIWSMHKKKNKERVLAGEMILTFVKDGKRDLTLARPSSKPDAEELVEEVLSEVAPQHQAFAGELLFNRLILKAWSRGALHSLDLNRADFSEILTKKGWCYNKMQDQWISLVPGPHSDYQLTF